MTSLIDTPTPVERELLRIVASGFRRSGDWPIWQYVFLELNRLGLDAESVARGLRQWQHHYRVAGWEGAAGSAPAFGTRVHLTVYGMVHAEDQVMTDLATAFVSALRVGASTYLAIKPSPNEVVTLTLTGEDVAAQVNFHRGMPVNTKELYALLVTEPATWSGLREVGNSFTWDLTGSAVHKFRDVATPHQYLIRLSDYLGTQREVQSPQPLPPMALPDALDRLDLVWRLVFGTRLLRILRAALPVELTQPAADDADFRARCSAFVDLLQTMTPAPRGKGQDGDPLVRLKSAVSDKLEGDPDVDDAVDVLTHLRGVRHSQQHAASRADYEANWHALGLDGFGDDWAGRWEHVRGVVARSLNLLADRLLSEHDAGVASQPRP